MARSTRLTAAARLSIPRLLFVILFARTILDTAFRGMYPFLPFIAADLNVTLHSAAQIVQARNLIGLTAPLLGPLSDRYGRRAVMFLGTGAMTVACLALFLVLPLWAVAAAMMLLAVGVTAFVPAQQAYLGDAVPYARRGRVIAVAELAWSASALIGLPLMGLALQWFGWRAAYGWLGILGLGVLALIRVAMPGVHDPAHAAGLSWGTSFGASLRAPGALATVLVTFLLAATNENLNIVFGVWMKDSFALDAIALGLVGAVIGGAELGGELFAVLYLDRLGKWRTVGACLLLDGIAYLLLPLMGATAWLGASGLALVYFFFELAVVSVLPVASELAPSARGTLLALVVASFSVGRAVGAFTGPALLNAYGFLVTGGFSAVGMLAAFLLWILVVREPRHTMISVP